MAFKKIKCSLIELHVRVRMMNIKIQKPVHYRNMLNINVVKATETLYIIT